MQVTVFFGDGEGRKLGRNVGWRRCRIMAPPVVCWKTAWFSNNVFPDRFFWLKGSEVEAFGPLIFGKLGVLFSCFKYVCKEL